jgi:putative acetyltransferase
MITFTRCSSSNEEFIKLTKSLDENLNQINGATQNAYNQYNRIHSIPTAIIAMENELSVGCGCFKEYDKRTVEIKRIYVKPEHRGKEIAKQLVAQLEAWAMELDYSKAILETGLQQLSAIRLYEKCGYCRIENYGQYVEMKNSVCFSKALNGVR